MYVPRQFAVDPATTRALLAGAATADLVTATRDGVLATLLPVLWDAGAGGHGTVLAHLSRGNPQWRAAPVGEALLLLRGPEGYVSPTWYPSVTDGRAVPTWDYVAVHAYGRLVVRDDPDWVEDVVRRLTDRHEASSPEPWSVDRNPPAFLAAQLRGVVGVEVVLSRVEAKAKLSQNRPPEDVDSVVDALRGLGALDLAEAVDTARAARPA